METPTPPTNLFHRTQGFYRKGEVIYPGTWGRLVEGFGPGHGRFIHEYVLERIRAADFSTKPSRMRACYAFENHGFATGWNRGAQGPGEYLYLVQLQDPSVQCHRGDMSLTDAISQCRTFDGIDDCARRYWRGEELCSDAWEWIIPCPLVVVARLSQIHEDSVVPAAAAAAAA